MRNLEYIIIAFICIAFISCKQEYDNWYSAGYELSGEWVVTVQQSVAEGEGETPNLANIENWEWDDLYHTGTTAVQTYNSAANDPAELIVEDNHTFWDYKVKVNANIDAKTFEVDNAPNLIYDCNVSILGGKVLEGVATTPSGNPADSIVFYVKFSDEAKFTYMKVSGYRKTGLSEDH